ncbi:MAG: TonB-dependent receptor [Gammaproteobacteria bacterium]|nr:TonB-dependent receptor [Gammaproteobacteria bacterium]
MNAQAADAPAASAEQTAAGGDGALEEVVVTASAGDKSRLRSSISVTEISQLAIQNFTPRSESELFRLIPGIRAEDTAGPGGNANITVRGLPIVTGGSEFVQLQEDGLPTVLFGDIQFGNNDYWLRYDDSVTRVEAVRGGSASTLASQAPGAVINYINDTGEKQGGSIRLTKALNYTENRLDFTYGGPLSDTVRFHVGGFIKDGNGATNIDYKAEQGYQVKANITKDINDGKGYIRLNFRRLDDKEPTYTNMPSLVNVSGGSIGGFSALPGFDARKQSNQSIYNQTFQVMNSSGQIEQVKMEGIHPKATSFGAEFHNEFSGNFTVDDKFRYLEQSGTFRTQFLNVATTQSVIGATVNGKVVGTIRYANGPNQGQVYTGPFLNNNPNIDTNMRDVGGTVNDLKFSGKFDNAAGRLTAHAGWFHMLQNIAMDWHVNPSYAELSGNNPAQLDLFTAAGAQLTAAGQAGFNNNWGTCCARTYDLSYTDDAPYLALNQTVGALDLDGSVRLDSVKASGVAQGGVAGPTVTVSDALGSAALPSLVPGGAQEVLNYTVHYTSWSFGALYSLNNDTSLFARASRGGRFNADRKTLGGNFNADGTLNAQGQSSAINIVTQQELGLKNRGRVLGGGYNFEATVFRARTADSNFDLTRPVGSQYDNKAYESYGLEVDGSWLHGGFSLTGDVTYTHAKITEDLLGNTQGNTPLATPRVIYLVSPAYEFGKVSLGATIDGQTSAYTDNDDAFSIDGQTFVNAFVKYRPLNALELGLNVNNLFNTLGYRGRGSVVSATATTPAVFQNSAVLGTTVTGSIAYRF